MIKKPSLRFRLARLFASNKFFWLIIALLVLQAAWIALSGRYPMAFDEDFHLGVIKLYAHHISPFWSHQPENADTFGAVARDPSYLYQYLMSFPYRLISLFTNNQTYTILILRFINIGLFAGGLLLTRNLLLKMRTSKALVNASLMIFVLLPIVPFQAAQINYDNLFFPVIAISLLLAVRLSQELNKRQLNIDTLLLLGSFCLLSCLVKYAFLPIFIAIVGFALVRLWQTRHYFKLGAAAAKSWRSLAPILKGTLIGLFIISAGLFVQRIGVNLVRYHTPVPSCDKVLTREQCSEYGPFARDYGLESAKAYAPHNPLTFNREWFYGMWLRTMFAVGGPSTDFQSRGPLIIPGESIIGFAAIGLIAFIATVKNMLKTYNSPVIWLFLAAITAYVASLWLDEYRAYIHTGQPVAINGRYLLPLLLPVILLLVTAVEGLFKGRPRLQAGLAIVVIICLVWGGGALTFILRSNDEGWYWPNSAVKTANHTVQNVFGPITPSYTNPALFLR